MPFKNTFLSTRVLLAMILLLSFVFPPFKLKTVNAATHIYRVTPDGVSTGNCGDTWTNSCNLEYALQTIVDPTSGDTYEFWVKQGTYYTGSGFHLKSGVALYGGFVGDGTEQSINDRDWVSNPTILSGDADQNDAANPATSPDQIRGSNSRHVVLGDGVSTYVILDGFIVTAGQANLSASSDAYGGGLNTSYGQGEYVISNVVFSGNSAIENGGGIYNWYAKGMTLQNVTFIGNTASNQGGGIYLQSGLVSMTDVVFEKNSAKNGGGIYNFGIDLTINYSQFIGNSATESGGGLSTSVGNIFLTNATFTKNSAYGNGGGLMLGGYDYSKISNVLFDDNTAYFGGGMYDGAQKTSYTNVTFQNNKAIQGGGLYGGAGVYNDVSFIKNEANYGGGLYGGGTLANLVFQENSAKFGGGMYGSGALSNITFYGNIAVFGGGLYGGGTIDSVTFSHNSVEGNGGALFLTNSPTELKNSTLVWNDADVHGGAIYNSNVDLAVTNVTVSGNTVRIGKGAGIYNDEFYINQEPRTHIINSILWGNKKTTVTGDQIPDPLYGPATVIYSVFQGGYTGKGNIDTEPFLGVFGNYGGPTDTFPLLPGSPAIDTADQSNCPEKDQRGVVRPQGQGCDIGAFEVSPEPPPESVENIQALTFEPVNPILFNGSPSSSLSTYSGKIIYVNGKANGINDGSSWKNAFTSLQPAIDAALAGDEIWVAKGTFWPARYQKTFTLKNGVALYGGFSGNGTEVTRNQRNWVTNPTILSGDLEQNDTANPVTKREQIIGSNAYHVVTIKNADATTVLDGFTITAGVAIDNTGNGLCPNGCNGGGIYSYRASPTLANLVVQGNFGTYGGGIYGDGGTLKLSHGSIHDNRATFGGGGIQIERSDPVLNDVEVSNNTGSSCGGMSVNGLHGAIIEKVTFLNNIANGSGDGGGLCLGNNAILNNVTFSGNSAYHGGALFVTRYASPKITNVSFINNSASMSGGAIYNAALSIAELTNVTFYGNYADTSGGAIYNETDANPLLTNVTITKNQINYSSGGGIFNYGGENKTVLIRNSIIWGNTKKAYYGDYPDQIQGDFTMVYTDIQGGYGFDSAGNIDANPLFSTLANYGGSTQTVLLQPHSPAINAGDPLKCPLTDQRGYPRPQGKQCDMGAVEIEYVATIYLPMINK